jgi:PAS domain S-box-containing protein
LEQFGSVRDFELKMCKKDGTEIDCLLTATARRSQDGQAIAFHGIIRDVTEQKRNEAILAKRAGELQAVAQLSTVATSILETEQLLQEVVDLTKSSFGLYHAHIYLLDEATENLVLAAGAGEVGQQMVAQGWSIPLTQEQSLVARAARERQGVIVNDIRLEPDFLPNPLLPDTRAEMAVPLLVGQNLLGVLDVQAEVVGRFTEEDIRINTTLAVQIAAALQNARLFSQAHSSLADLKQSQNLLRSIIDATPDWIFIKDQEYRYRLANQGYANALHLLPEDFVGKNDLELGFPEELVKGNPEKGIRGFWTDDRQVMDSGEPLVNPYDPATIDGEVHIFHTIKAPVRDTAGNVTGVLAFARDTTEREHILAEMERRARRERTIRQITDKIRAATSLEELVKTAAQELGERLSAGHAVVELGIDLESKLETGSNGR